MHRATRTARLGRLLVVALVVALVGSLGAAARPAPGAAAEALVEPSTAPSPSQEVIAEPSSAPSPGAPATAGPTPTPSPPPTSAPTPPPTPKPVATPTPSPSLAPYPSQCVTWRSQLERANLLLQNRYHLQNHPVVQLGSNPTWRENPLGSANWQFLHHSLGSVQQLLHAYALTADVRYRDKAIYLMKDWLADNPRSNPASVWAWNDHGTALRAIMFSCAALYLPKEPWLVNALKLHGQTLADSSFYVKQGNHALDQSIGLLEVAGTLGRTDWQTLARDRMGTLLVASVDAQGVTNEQSVGYQNYNRKRYTLAEARLRAWRLAVPTAFSRIRLMPNFLAHATRPDARYEMLGDTDFGSAEVVPGTWAEYAATQGQRGPRPSSTVALYRAGFLFARTGWGGSGRVFADERFMSLRFGPAPIIHGHADGGSVGLYGYGTSLLVDPGGYYYNQDAWRRYFKNRTAHNVVTVDGVAWNSKSHTTLSCSVQTATMSHACVYQPGTPGTSHIRRVTFSRALGYVLVDDQIASSSTRTYRQLWHLPADAKPLVRASSFNTQRGRGNLQARQLIGGTMSRVVMGQTSPTIQGWVAYQHGVKAAAPVVEVAKRGSRARFVTLLTTAAGTPAATVSGLTVTSNGYQVTVTVGRRSERVVVSGNSASITPLN